MLVVIALAFVPMVSGASVAAGAISTADKDRALRSATQVLDAASSAIRLSQFRAGAITRGTGRARRLASSKSSHASDGRQLSGSPCSFSSNDCVANQATLTSMASQSTNSTIGQALQECQICSDIAAQDSCISNNHCMWQAEEQQCSCKAGELILSEAVERSGSCGWWAKSLESGARCSAHGTDAAACAADSLCKTEPSYELPAGATEGSTCNQTQHCVPNGDMHTALCGAGFNYTAAMLECMTASYGVYTASMSQVEFQIAMSKNISSCIGDICAPLGDMLSLVSNAQEVCLPINSFSNCSANEQCMWQDGNGCVAHHSRVMEESIPNDCIMKSAMELNRKCREKTRSTCTGDCTWETSLQCNVSTFSVLAANEEGCQGKVEKFYEAIAVASCDADAVLLHDVTKLINSCGAATTESACSSVRSNSSVRAQCGLDEETGISAGSGIHGIRAVAAALAAAAASVFCSA